MTCIMVKFLPKQHIKRQKSFGLIFISVLFRELYFPFQVFQFTPSLSAEGFVWWYMPFRFEFWHLSYHQAPWCFSAQLPSSYSSLSLSRVVNSSARWVRKESPAVPEILNHQMSTGQRWYYWKKHIWFSSHAWGTSQAAGWSRSVSLALSVFLRWLKIV